MALNVQDETGAVVDANGYVSVADMTAHLALRGIDISAEATADVEVAIVKATDYIDSRWSFSSEKLADGQTTEFPRYAEYGEDELNPAIVRACVLYASEALTVDLWKTSEELDSARLTKIDESVDVLKDVKEYAYPASTKKAFDQADACVKKCGYLAGGAGGTIILSRI